MSTSSSPKNLLSLFDFTMIVVSLVIGMGIFRTPVNVAKAVPEPWIFFTAWLLGGLIAMCGALTYAEIGSRLPVTGGYYRIFSYAYHPSLGFAINCIILISNAASGAGVALIGAEYFSRVISPGTANTETLKVTIAIISILLFYGVNLMGLRMSARATNVLMMIKIGMILMLILPIFFTENANTGQLTVTDNREADWMDMIRALGVGLIAVSFTYGGYQQNINFGSEVRNAPRNLPRGVFLGISIIILLYLTINYAYYHTIGFDQLRQSEGIAAIMASKVFGEAGQSIISVLLFLSVLAYINTLLLSNPRVMYAMSEDGVLPRVFARKWGRDVLITSLTVFAAIAIVVVFYARQFDEILNFTIFLDCIGMATSAGAIFLLRRRQVKPEGQQIYAMKAYPLYPVIFILAYAFIATSIFIDTPRVAITGLVVLAIFIALFFLFRRRQKING